MVRKSNGVFIILVCLFALSFMACPDSGGSNDSPSGNSVVGIWEGIISETEYGLTYVLNVSFNLKANNTYTAVFTGTATYMGITDSYTEYDNGTYSVDGNTITFVSQDYEEFSGIISGKTITMSGDGLAIVLHKK